MNAALNKYLMFNDIWGYFIGVNGAVMLSVTKVC
jgi:hypothetical protein